VLDEVDQTPRQRRRVETTRAILAAAWAQCRRDGLASLSLRELADAVDMRAPSLYSYFESKDAIYDAMFREGQEQLGDAMRDLLGESPVTRDLVKRCTRRWFEFCLADPVRYQLMFQRVVPGFEPSAESYALAVERFDEMTKLLRDAGIDDPSQIDLFTGLVAGLVSQQLTNEPSSDRWARLLDDAIDMFLDHVGVLTDG
jgi:AcrR family transcriptional regulator